MRSRIALTAALSALLSLVAPIMPASAQESAERHTETSPTVLVPSIACLDSFSVEFCFDHALILARAKPVFRFLVSERPRTVGGYKAGDVIWESFGWPIRDDYLTVIWHLWPEVEHRAAVRTFYCEAPAGPDSINPNRDGTFDIGFGQHNSAYVAERLARYGFEPDTDLTDLWDNARLTAAFWGDVGTWPWHCYARVN